MRYLIVGAGPAGVVAAETLRGRDAAAEITIIGDEPEAAYSRMAIPYLLAKQIAEQGTWLRHSPAHFSNMGIGQLQDRVVAVDPASRSVHLEQGGQLPYDKLLLATGSQAVRPPVEGLDQPAIHHCWTLDDARQIIRLAVPGSRVTLMGAGFIGCIIMEALMAMGVELTVIEMGDRMVPRMMDDVAGNLIKQWCLDKGVKVYTSTRVQAVAQDLSTNATYQLDCGAAGTIPADLVVVATGVRPNTDFLQGSGIEIARGILVDQYQRSSVADVYAAGDVCEGFDWSTGERTVNAIQPVAAETGRVAALNMSGATVPYGGGLAMNVLDTLGLISTSYGLWMGADDSQAAVLLDKPGYRYIKLQFVDDRLVGAITLGVTEHVGVLRGLIQTRIRLGHWKERLMENPSRMMEAYLAMNYPAQLAP